MSSAFHVLAPLSLFLAAVTPASAQTPRPSVPVDSGKLVRMHTASQIITGRLTARFGTSDDSLRYCRYPGPPCAGQEDSVAMRTIAAGQVQWLEVSNGTRWRKGATIGGLVGAALGGISTSFLISFCETSDCRSKSYRNRVVALGVLSGALTSGALGAIWGAGFPRWPKVP